VSLRDDIDGKRNPQRAKAWWGFLFYKSILHLLVIAVSAVFFNCTCVFAEDRGSERPEHFGRFIGSLKFELLDDGRTMRLLEPYTFVDRNNESWVAPAGLISDGASIPQIGWTIVGGPFEGKYRNAAVIHDFECEHKYHTWESVHEMFYFAMRASGVNEVKAGLMYYAVYQFGPRWPIERTILARRTTKTIEAADLKIDIDNESKIRFLSFSRSLSNPEEVEIKVLIEPSLTTVQLVDTKRLTAFIRSRSPSLKEIREFR
jgi:hypothetical protein